MSHMDNFPPEIQEKVERLFDILSRIYSVPFLSKRLAFYGGTCLNFVHLERASRLSLDLDFNFRETGVYRKDSSVTCDERVRTRYIHFKQQEGG